MCLLQKSQRGGANISLFAMRWLGYDVIIVRKTDLVNNPIQRNQDEQLF
jgi:hypothetical protein